MKHIFFGFMAVALLFSASCQKTNSTATNTIRPNGSGAWTFKGITYNVTIMALGKNSNTSPNDIAASNFNGSNSNTYAQLLFTFSGTTTPAAGRYLVVSQTYSGSATSTVNVITTLGGASGGGGAYSSTGKDNVYATVSVSNGHITISLASAELVSISGGTGTAAITNLRAAQL